MTHIEPLEREKMVEFEGLFVTRDGDMGFTSNSMLTMAHWPELLKAWMTLGRATIFEPGEIPQDLKALIAFVVSLESGSRYCTAHSANHSVNKAGIAAEKIEKAFEYETNRLFSDAERAALRVAQLGGDTNDEDFVELKKYFTDRQSVEIVAVAGFMSFLNRWNDTLAIELEDWPRDFAQHHLASSGWEVGKHKSAKDGAGQGNNNEAN